MKRDEEQIQDIKARVRALAGIGAYDSEELIAAVLLMINDTIESGFADIESGLADLSKHLDRIYNDMPSP
jgi:hypothetical protein